MPWGEGRAAVEAARYHPAMRVLIACDKFKGSLTAMRAAEAMAAGVRRAMRDAQVDLCPIADGGEGTVQAMIDAVPESMSHPMRVTGPLGEQVDATWATLADNTAAIETASAAGLALVPKDRRDPTRTTTFGVGQLIAAALDHGCRHIIIGIGGSATTDAGIACAQALGVRFDTDAACLHAPLTGGDMQRITRIDTTQRDARLNETRIEVACDVTNPLFGPDGAAYVYAPQKGATPDQVRQLDEGLRHIARLTCADDAGATRPGSHGSGAAGGLGFGLVQFCGAHLRRGIDIVLDAVHFDERLAQADLVLTGEGRLDDQSLSGKAAIGVAERAAKQNKPVIALVGSLGEHAERCKQFGISEYHALVSGDVTLEQAMRNAGPLLTELAYRVLANPSSG
ncbi:MAG: glycerate kinase [Phycisphaerales bacterium]